MNPVGIAALVGAAATFTRAGRNCLMMGIRTVVGTAYRAKCAITGLTTKNDKESQSEEKLEKPTPIRKNAHKRKESATKAKKTEAKAPRKRATAKKSTAARIETAKARKARKSTKQRKAS